MGTGIGEIGTIALRTSACACHALGLQTGNAATAGTNTAAAPSNEERVSGRVILQGLPPPRTIVLDAMCGKLHTNALTEADYRVGEANGLADVFVYAGCARGRRRNAGRRSPVAGSAGLSLYAKGVWRARKSEIQIRNSDPLLHNVHAVPKTNSEFNFAQPIKGQVNEKAFSKRSSSAHQMRCASVDEYLRRRGAAQVFAVTDDKGHFRLPGGLPAGKYTIEAVHPKAGRVAGKSQWSRVRTSPWS